MVSFHQVNCADYVLKCYNLDGAIRLGKQISLQCLMRGLHICTVSNYSHLSFFSWSIQKLTHLHSNYPPNGCVCSIIVFGHFSLCLHLLVQEMLSCRSFERASLKSVVKYGHMAVVFVDQDLKREIAEIVESLRLLICCSDFNPAR